MKRHYNVDFDKYSYTVAAESPREAVSEAIIVDMERCSSDNESDERLADILDMDDIDVYELGPQGFDDAIPYTVSVDDLCRDLN